MVIRFPQRGHVESVVVLKHHKRVEKIEEHASNLHCLNLHLQSLNTDKRVVEDWWKANCTIEHAKREVLFVLRNLSKLLWLMQEQQKLESIELGNARLRNRRRRGDDDDRSGARCSSLHVIILLFMTYQYFRAMTKEAWEQ
jgi:hypothetical protein